MKPSSIATLLVLAALSARTFAGPLKEAKINQIVNDVKVVEPRQGARTAALQETIKDDLGVATGAQSRAELLFQDNTLTRLGAETFFSFRPGSRDLNLDRGSMLLQVPKNLGGARIRAASVTASITGTTIMMENLPGKAVKIVVLEGSLRVAVDRRPGENVMLNAGKMVIIAPEAKELPKPIDVDLRKLVRTSVLIDPVLFKGTSKSPIAALPSIGLIAKEIALQDEKVKGHTLVTASFDASASGSDTIKLAQIDPADLATSKAKTDTPLPTANFTPEANEAKPTTTVSSSSGPGSRTASSGSGLTDPATQLNFLPETTTGAGTTTTGTGTTTTGTGTTTTGTGTTTTGTGTTTTGTGTTTTGTGTGTLTPIAVTLDTTLPAISLTGASVVNTSTLTGGQALNQTGANGLLIFQPGAGGALDLRGPSIAITPSKINGINLNGGNGVLNLTQEGGSGGVLVAGTETAPIAGNIDVTAPITATTGKNSLTTPYGGSGGHVQFVANGAVTVKSTIKVSDSVSGYQSKNGGSIGIKSANGISVTSSGQLLSLLAAASPGTGGTIKFVAAGGNILVEGKVQADRGTVEMGTTGASNNIELKNAAISGDVVKIGALGANGQLIVGGGTISADTALKLYAGTTDGEVRFTNNVTLGGASTKTIAGRTVSIDNGKTVTIGGTSAANVFTDRANYTGSGGNNSTTGKFGGAGAITKPFAQTPAF